MVSSPSFLPSFQPASLSSFHSLFSLSPPPPLVTLRSAVRIRSLSPLFARAHLFIILLFYYFPAHFFFLLLRHFVDLTVRYSTNTLNSQDSFCFFLFHFPTHPIAYTQLQFCDLVTTLLSVLSAACCKLCSLFINTRPRFVFPPFFFLFPFLSSSSFSNCFFIFLFLIFFFVFHSFLLCSSPSFFSHALYHSHRCPLALEFVFKKNCLRTLSIDTIYGAVFLVSRLNGQRRRHSLASATGTFCFNMYTTCTGYARQIGQGSEVGNEVENLRPMGTRIGFKVWKQKLCCCVFFKSPACAPHLHALATFQLLSRAKTDKVQCASTM